MSTGGEVANALVCKTSIRRFNSGPVLQSTCPSCDARRYDSPSAFSPRRWHSFALYQGTTSVVPSPAIMVRALAPATAKSARNSNAKKAQGLKPDSFAAFTARLKSCPDTKQKSAA
jgi:hypothetical protein